MKRIAAWVLGLVVVAAVVAIAVVAGLRVLRPDPAAAARAGLAAERTEALPDTLGAVVFTVAIGALALALVIGVSLGLLAGYLGGWVDSIVNRLTETAMAFPNLLLAVGIAVVIGPGLLNVVIIIALFTWYYPARIVRGATVSTKRMTFVAAARTVGARPRRILLVHLLPQVWGPLLVYGTSIIANNIIFEAGLSYLGVGVPPPTPSWGSMLSDAVTSGMYQTDIGLALVPGIALVMTMLAFNLLGDGIRDALDPKGRR